MKKNIYTCDTCGHEIKTANRDEGTTPMLIGCTVYKCVGMAQSKMYIVDQDLEADYIFISPKGHLEWRLIRSEVEAELNRMFPRKSKIRISRKTDKAMENIKYHVHKGGIVQVRKEMLNKLK